MVEINEEDAFGEFGDLGNPGGADFKMPSIEDVMKLIEKMDGIGDDEREKLRSSLMNEQANAEDMFKQQILSAQGHSTYDYLMLLAMLSIIGLIFVLFGYKLYKSLMEKENKKQEKIKAKQSKKKGNKAQ